jgi:cytosine/adenosine deaminase-related metal-dependent hydrolase
VKPSLIDEMRAATLLQKIRALDGSALGARAAFDLGTRSGAAALGIGAGALEAGRYADYAVLDTSAIDPWTPAVNAVVYRGESSWVREVYVGGRRVRERARSNVAENSARALRALVPRLQLHSKRSG